MSNTFNLISLPIGESYDGPHLMGELLDDSKKKASLFELHRGNHEARSMNKLCGSERGVKAKYDEKIFDLFLEVFSHMPFASVVGKEVFFTHRTSHRA